MCTVTIIPKGVHDFVLTTNRDEAPNRISLPPDFYRNKETRLLFPMDKLSGGTWVGLSEKNRVVCLLNGAFTIHKRKENYEKSRGLVVLDFLISENILSTVKTYHLNNIEPFTMVVVDWNTTLKFFELVWDGTEKHFKELPLEPKIWSSSTLYTAEMKQERLQWFESFKAKNNLNAQTLLQFHKTAGINNKDYGVIMNRGFVKTTSITQIEKFSESLEMYHENLQKKTISSKTFQLTETVND
ncbi:NRDE family protein [Mariniflexile litorale]|uniref:NRDE family protein n=1 Tax=Mariniflexile litorale TaxID=3045158 RepID=A0AAU7EHT4_9FLAO|nr:NRDE family protein [Mariniflexile sp. KMM 9835]MDQ8210183.1 NRDE family protein [Mariniflexile sp. KMM 9835]